MGGDALVDFITLLQNLRIAMLQSYFWHEWLIYVFFSIWWHSTPCFQKLYISSNSDNQVCGFASSISRAFVIKNVHLAFRAIEASFLHTFCPTKEGDICVSFPMSILCYLPPWQKRQIEKWCGRFSSIMQLIWLLIWLYKQRFTFFFSHVEPQISLDTMSNDW